MYNKASAGTNAKKFGSANADVHNMDSHCPTMTMADHDNVHYEPHPENESSSQLLTLMIHPFVEERQTADPHRETYANA